MKKFLMVTTAIAGAAFMSAPASAAVDLDVGGYFRGYFADVDQDGVVNTYEQEFRRDTELHFSGETTLDNGLTIGAQAELGVGMASGDSVDTDEIYAYASGGWGRVNLGVEDGAAYLLQVAAPSADANVDGMGVTIEGIADRTVDFSFLGGIEAFRQDKLQYAQTDFSESDRITYLSPKYNGFQAGVSYMPRNTTASNNGVMNEPDNEASGVVTGTAGVSTITSTEYTDFYELSARYDGEYQGFGFSVGAGYSAADLERESVITEDYVNATGATTDNFAQTDGVDTYNIGANVMFQNFSLGGSWMTAKTAITADSETDAAGITLVSADLTRDTYVIGGAYDNGPYHVGVSYLNQQTEQDGITGLTAGVADDVTGYKQEVDKLTVGGGYSFGPGMTFRGAVAWGDKEVTGVVATARNLTAVANSAAQDFTQITIGTDVKF